MEKYGTYRVYKNTRTGELLRVPVGNDHPPDFEKQASEGKWEELDKDPEETING